VRAYIEGVPEGLSFDIAAETLSRAGLWDLVTSAGRLHIVFQPSGTKGFEDLDRNAVRFDVFGVALRAADLRDIARSKAAAGRPQDLQDVAVLRDMLRRAGRKRTKRTRR
jgi:hypothetical protein